MYVANIFVYIYSEYSVVQITSVTHASVFEMNRAFYFTGKPQVQLKERQFSRTYILPDTEGKTYMCT